jgi:hypothetical protein
MYSTGACATLALGSLRGSRIARKVSKGFAGLGSLVPVECVDFTVRNNGSAVQQSELPAAAVAQWESARLKFDFGF